MLHLRLASFVPWLLVALAACGGGGGGGGGDDPLAVESAALVRANAAGGDDLYVVPTSGASAPRLVAQHGSDAIFEALPDLVAGRVVYATGNVEGDDLWSTPLAATDTSERRQLTSIAGLQVWDWAAVANRWVVFLAYIEGAPSLWRVDVATTAATAPQQISTPGAIDVYWRSDWVDADGWVCFEEDVTGVYVTRAVAPTTAISRRTLSRIGAPDTYFLPSVIDYAAMPPLFVGGRILMVERAILAGVERWTLLCLDGPQATPRILALDLRNDEIAAFAASGVSGGSFCYVKSNVGTVAPPNESYNLFAVRLDGSDGGIPRQLSQFFAGNSITELYPATDRCYWLNARSTGAGFEYDLYAASPEAGNLTSPVLIGPGNVAPGSVVYGITPLAGARIAFVRELPVASSAQTIRVARADVAGSEAGQGPINDFAAVDADGIAGLDASWTIPAAPRAIAVSAETVGSTFVDNLYRVAPTGSGWSCVQCNVEPAYPIDGSAYWVRAGNRILYGTDSGFRAFDAVNPAVATLVLDGALPFYSAFPAGNGGAGYLYFDTDVGVFSARCAGAYPSNLATIHEWGGGEDFGDLGGAAYAELGGRNFFAVATTARNSIRVVDDDNGGSVDLSRSATAFDLLLGCFRP